jgi:potassium-dependent mechanosensitive channel
MHGLTRQSLLRCARFLILASLGVTLTAHASIASLLAPASATAEAAPTAPAIEPVAPAEIPARADIDERVVQDVVVRAAQKDPTAALKPALQALTQGVHDLAEIFRKEEVNELPVVRLESLERHWNFYDRQLADWRKRLQAVTAQYSADAARLSQMRATWEATRNVPGMPQALVNRATVLAQQIAIAEQALSGPLDEQLKLGRRANALQASIDAGRKDISAAIDFYDTRLLTSDAAPLWEVVGRPEPR